MTDEEYESKRTDYLGSDHYATYLARLTASARRQALEVKLAAAAKRERELTEKLTAILQENPGLAQLREDLFAEAERRVRLSTLTPQPSTLP